MSKRIGMWLRNLNTSLSEDVLTRAGKRVKGSVLAGKKGLTNADINKLQAHYAANIRKYDTVDSIHDAIFVT